MDPNQKILHRLAADRHAARDLLPAMLAFLGESGAKDLEAFLRRERQACKLAGHKPSVRGYTAQLSILRRVQRNMKGV